MNRISAKFDELRRTGRKGFIGYLTAGDPDVKTSERNIRAAVANGVDILEVGVPFSDPTADGPVIQDASQRALAAGMTPGGVLDLVRRLRSDLDAPIVLFGYANPLFQYGYDKVAAAAAEAGVDGLLVVDIPFGEEEELREAAADHGLYLIPLLAPTTTSERATAILKGAEGFAYYIMVTGVTGAREQVVADLGRRVAGLRRISNIPIAVGFGVSNGKQAAEAVRNADAVVVGSALVRAASAGNLAEAVSDIRRGLDGEQA